MKCKQAPTSTKIGLILATMAATFFTFFVIVLSIGNKIREKETIVPTPPPSITSTNPTSISTFPPSSDAPAPPSIPPTSLSPTSIAPTISSLPPTDPEPNIISSTATTPPTKETCPWPPTNIESMEWGVIGDSIQGKITDDDLYEQPVDIANDGNTVVMGAPGGYKGTAIIQVMNFIGASWKEEDSFSGSGGDRFGRRISLSGDGRTLAIGVRSSDEGGTESGHVEVYQRTKEGGWKPKGNKIVGLQARNEFGWSVSLNQNGNQLAVGAPGSKLNGIGSGSVQIFQFQNKDWVQLGQVIPGEAAGDRFGEAVSLSAYGNIVAVGAPEPWSNENGSNSGSVQMFRYFSTRRTQTTTNTHRNMQSEEEGRQWLQIGQKLLGQDSKDYFGRSLSINAKGDTIAVGTSYGNYVEVFHFQDEQWKQLGKTLTGENYFGESVSIAANTQRVAVGPRDEEGGYVRVYDFNSDDWVKVGDITATTSEEYFGRSISLSSCGDQLAVGLIYDDGTNNRHGRMKVYEFA